MKRPDTVKWFRCKCAIDINASLLTLRRTLKGGSIVKRILFLTSLFLFPIFSANAQEVKKGGSITETKWPEIVKALSQEDWSAAYTLSSDELKRTLEAAEPRKLAMLRYAYLYSAAGKVFEGTMTYDVLEKAVRDYIGKEIAFPPRKIKLGCQGAFNFICPSEEGKNKAMVAAANRKGTSIFAFEYLEFKDKVDLAEKEGKKGEITGVIKDIAPNPNRTTIVILRIYVSNANIEVL